MIKIRKFQIGDEFALWQMKLNTIRHVNSRDYSPEQVQAWAPDVYDAAKWSERVRAMDPFVAEIDGQIVGFADHQSDGYIDHFFCHHQYQGQGIGKALMQSLMDSGQEKKLPRFYSHVSITAKPFFERCGFRAIAKQAVEVNGQVLTNYVMERIS